MRRLQIAQLAGQHRHRVDRLSPDVAVVSDTLVRRNFPNGDAIGQRIGCLPDERQILADAALLHDIGYHINYEKHHKHSYHLVQHAELLGITPAEQILVANVAAFKPGQKVTKSTAK